VICLSFDIINIENGQHNRLLAISRCGTGILILRLASRLDAFSGYPYPT
jgi:hypothetical protein